MTFLSIAFLALIWTTGSVIHAFDIDVVRLHVGCFKDVAENRDLPKKIDDSLAQGSIDGCVQACAERYYMYAGVQNGDECYCGSSHGKYGPGRCYSPCARESDKVCGGPETNSIYKTGITVPGPPQDLQLISATTNTLNVEWQLPEGSPTGDFIHSFRVQVDLNKSFDPKNRRFSPKDISVSGTKSSTKIIGLEAGAQYNVTVSAQSEGGQGPGATQLFWTEIGDPDIPETPQLITHGDDHGDHHHGELHIKFKPLNENSGGPITSYRIVVINETEPAPFDEDNLFGWEQANEKGLKFWICAEVKPNWFEFHDEFVVGDQKTYGGYYNHGPLDENQDFHVTVGAVSSFNNVTKVSYAKVSHDQHRHENIIVFQFHDHSSDDHDHDHDDHKKSGYTLVRDNHGLGHDERRYKTDNLTTGLIVAIVIVSILLIGIMAFYIFLRCYVKHSNISMSDAQELTTQIHTLDNDVEAFANGGLDTKEEQMASLDQLRKQTWQIPRNFLEITHDVIGRGKFGSVVKGKVNKRGTEDAAIVQIIPGNLLDAHDFGAMIKDAEVAVACGEHQNVLQMIGMCEENDSIFFVLEEGVKTLKQVLLDSRALIHFQAFALKNQTVSSLREAEIFAHLIAIAKGMQHLSNLKIFHKKLCARNVFLVNNVPKIAGIGIMEYASPDLTPDYLRWTAQEAYKSRSFATKCDVWSFGILMWEMVTLGATPYASVSTQELPAKVIRGLRPGQTRQMSPDLYQLMLECWQFDLDERPTFSQLVEHLEDMKNQGSQNYLQFAICDGFEYEPFCPQFEVLESG